jgi:agmatine deiminase
MLVVEPSRVLTVEARRQAMSSAPHDLHESHRPKPGTPRAAGYRMPAEFDRHERCLIAWPTRTRAYWGEYYMLAQHTYAAVARAIARFEPVTVLARPGEGPEATSYCGSDGIEVVEMPLDDSWIRDSGPNWVRRADGARALADFGFNSWGERYLPYDDDARIGERLAGHFGVERFATPMVLEGGSITVDGEGTLITTESCLLHPTRNPGMTKDEIERELKDMLGVEKVIWLVSGLGLEEDPDTDGHVDGVAAFVGPARVLLHMVRDPHHPDYENLMENRRRLETTDALGREIEVVECDRRSAPVRVGGRDIVETFVNFYQANGAVIVPTGGNAADLPALEWLAEVFAGREVVGVPAPVVGYGGGGVHCITQQVPLGGTASRVSAHEADTPGPRAGR